MIVYAINWTESESGWGQRPDGFSIHSSLEDAEQYIELYWETELMSNPSGETPDEYSFPDEPREIELDVPDEWAGKLGGLGVRVYQHEAHLKIESGKKAEVVYRAKS